MTYLFPYCTNLLPFLFIWFGLDSLDLYWRNYSKILVLVSVCLSVCLWNRGVGPNRKCRHCSCSRLSRPSAASRSQHRWWRRRRHGWGWLSWARLAFRCYRNRPTRGGRSNHSPPTGRSFIHFIKKKRISTNNLNNYIFVNVRFLFLFIISVHKKDFRGYLVGRCQGSLLFLLPF